MTLNNAPAIALAQINVTVGDLKGNSEKIVAYAKRAHANHAQLFITPELALTGYPPEDLLLRPSFYNKCEQALTHLIEALSDFKGMTLVIGHPYRKNAFALTPFEYDVAPTDTFNAASIIQNGQIIGTYFKQALPNTNVFDEKRYFVKGNKPFILKIAEASFGLLICEDIWHADIAFQTKQAGADAFIVINASPYHIDKEKHRLQIMQQRVKETNCPLIYLNMVGGQDELIFDGGSFAINTDGQQLGLSPQFIEKLSFFEWKNNGFQYIEEDCETSILKSENKKIIFKENKPLLNATVLETIPSESPSLTSQIYSALILGVKDYVTKNGFTDVVIGLSGGVDSALVLTIAIDALGPQHVHAVMMPTRFTADISLEDAKQLAENTKVHYKIMPIEAIVETFFTTLAPAFQNQTIDTTEENIQARARGTLLMALSNKFNYLVLTTGNKSEMAVGYCTLYGDMAGGFSVIKDIEKTLVYQLCYYRNKGSNFKTKNMIPERILTRAPSAELRENQTDQDTLPPYDLLDPIIKMVIEENKSLADIVSAGFDENTVKRVIKLIQLNEYKRRQAPIGIRITPRAFGKDWRYPITSGNTS